MADKQQDLESQFRSVLENVVEAASALKPFCKTVDDLIEVAKLATTNDGQLKILMDAVTRKK